MAYSRIPLFVLPNRQKKRKSFIFVLLYDQTVTV